MPRISNYYYKLKSCADVARYIQRCMSCLKAKVEQQSSCGQMRSSQVPLSRPWQLVSADHVEPLPRTISGFSYIFFSFELFL